MEITVHSPSEFGQVIRQIRKSKNLNQEEAGKSLRLGQRTVSTLEQGFPGTRLETLFRILAALDLEIVIRTKNKSSRIIEDPDRW